MKQRTKKYMSLFAMAALFAAFPAYAQYGLSPADFNKMYYLATQGQVALLREAVGRGLDIDSVNPSGDTGLCIAIKRNNYAAYNSFRLAGANPRHYCTMRIQREYQRFIAEHQSTYAKQIANNSSSLYYNNSEISWLPWILGGALVGGGVWALSNSGGGGSSSNSGSSMDSPSDDGGSKEEPVTHGYGLAGYLDNYTHLISNGDVTNKATVDGSNDKADQVVNKISLLPNIIDNHSYLKAYAKVTDGASYHNLSGGRLILGDAAIGGAAYGTGSRVLNDGVVDVEASNGTIGLVASNGGQAINAGNVGNSATTDDGSIRFIFKGGKEGDTVIGMYGDTHATITNYGKINGASAAALSDGNSSGNNDDSVLASDDEGATITISSNSGTMLGMALFNLYSGTNYTSSLITAQNYGNITLLAGNNNATSAAISLIGMGSYLDDNFLNGKNNPAFAEQMILQNFGEINLAYQKTYNIVSDALKLGNGGVIGIRADASTGALNRGTIKIDMQATSIADNNDVAAGMLSVHGAGLVNGNVASVYDGTTTNTGGTIQIINEATSLGRTYGMLAAKGSGTQTSLYKWQTPFLHNYGLIDMQVSNSFGMASFAGGEVINDGVINLGVENGQSYYSNNKGIYAEGSSVTEVASLINNGIINIFSEKSAAIYNDFSGSVTQTNTGSVYLSNKATDSKVFGGKYSTAINTGDIWYKVGNSESWDSPEGRQDDIGFNIQKPLESSVTTASGDNSSTKQYVVNEESGVIELGGVRDKTIDYGGTFGTVGIMVSQQGSARNKGLMRLVKFDEDIMQFNTAMYLTSDATAEAYIENMGNIYVDAANSIGMWNSSNSSASATNFGNIYANGEFSYGMAVSEIGGNLFNGRYVGDADEDKTIHVNGRGAIGMYIRNGNGWNYGHIKLLGDHTTAFQLDGEKATVWEDGEITHTDGLKDVTYYWMTNGATRTFEHEIYEDPNAPNEEDRYWTIPFEINGYTLGKVTKDKTGGSAYFSKNSIGYVTGTNSHLFVAKGEGSKVYNQGDVTVSGGAKAITAKEGAEAYNDTRFATMTINDNGSIGMYGTDENTKLETTVGSKLNVHAGIGMQAEGLATAINGGNITVTGGTGMFLQDGNSKKYTNGINTGRITVTGVDNTGVEVRDGGHFTNNAGKIFVSALAGDTSDQRAVGIYSDSYVENTGTKLEPGLISVGDNSVGIYVAGGTAKNLSGGSISVNGDNAYGVLGNIENSGTITVLRGVGVDGIFNNKGEIKVDGGIGVDGSLDNAGTLIVNGGTGVSGSIINKGNVQIYGGVGIEGAGTNSASMEVYGGEAVRATGSFENVGTITGTGLAIDVDGGNFTNKGTISLQNGTGVKVNSGSAVNVANITMTNGTGMHVVSGSATNSGEIKVTSGTGIFVEGGTATNSGTITVGDGNGMRVIGGHGYNVGQITLSGSGTGVLVGGSGSFINAGKITFSTKNGGHCGVSDGICEDVGPAEEEGADPASVHDAVIVMADENSQFINSGTVDLSGLNVDFDKSGNYVLASGGKYKANSFNGHVTASQNIVLEGFEDSYQETNAFEGQDNGLDITSESYMFEANVQGDGQHNDVVLSRKNFNDLVKERDLAQFFEMNYKAQNNESMYRAMKSATTATEFSAHVESESGKRFYANLSRENMAVLRGLQNDMQKRVLEDGLNGGVAGASYFRTGKDGTDNLSNYKDDVYSLYAGYGQRLNSNWSIGGSLMTAYADSKYDDINSERENKILMAFLPIMYQNNRFKFLTTPHVGIGFGEYTRKTLVNEYDADTFDIYYGLYNHAEYSIDLKIAELVTEAELNLQGVSSDKAKEKGGLYMKDNDSTSLEGGIGIKLRKRIQLAKEREIMLAIGTKYYHEFLDPYKDLTIGAAGITNTYRLKGYDEDENRLRSTAEAAYRDGNFVLSAEIAHNVEKESNVEGGVNMRYKF